MPLCDIGRSTTSMNDRDFTESGGAICSDCRRWPTTSARLIYTAYPDHDLLPIEPPRVEETIHEFNRRTGRRLLGDTLFQFLCMEADDQIDAGEYVRRLGRAMADIEAVRVSVLAYMAETPADPAGEGGG